jgi:large subunit ribosomal protein L29
MKILSSSAIRTLDTKQIQTEIVNLKKILFDFRLKQATRQSIKPHLIQMYKRQLARVMTIEHQQNIGKSLSTQKIRSKQYAS